MMDRAELAQIIIKLKRIQCQPNVIGIEDAISFLDKLFHRDILIIDSKKIKSHLQRKQQNALDNPFMHLVDYGVDFHLMLKKQVSQDDIIAMTASEQVKFEKQLYKNMEDEFIFGFKDLFEADLKEDTSND